VIRCRTVPIKTVNSRFFNDVLSEGEKSMSSVSQIRIRARLAKPPEYVLVKFPRYEREFFLGYANFILGLILSRAIREMFSNSVWQVKFQQPSIARYVEEGMVQRVEKTYMRQWADKIDGVLRSQFSSLIDDVSVGKEP